MHDGMRLSGGCLWNDYKVRYPHKKSTKHAGTLLVGYRRTGESSEEVREMQLPVKRKWGRPKRRYLDVLKVKFGM